MSPPRLHADPAVPGTAAVFLAFALVVDAEHEQREERSRMMADRYMKWWTSIETDTRKSMMVAAHRDPEKLHALLRIAFEQGQADATPPSPSTTEALAALEDLSKGAEIAKSMEWVNDRASVVLAALASRPAVEAGESIVNFMVPEGFLLVGPGEIRGAFERFSRRANRTAEKLGTILDDDLEFARLRAALATKPATSAPGAAGDGRAAENMVVENQLKIDGKSAETRMDTGSHGGGSAALEDSFRAGIQQTRATLCGEPGDDEQQPPELRRTHP